MSVYSMTGYASMQTSITLPAAKIAGDTEVARDTGSRLGIELRSVNGRFLDLAFRLPDELRQSEPTLREMLVARLRRGKVEVRVSIENSLAGTLRAPSPATLQRLASIEDSVKSWLPQATHLSVADVLRIATYEEKRPFDHGADLLRLANKAVDELMSARQREGERLALMLQDRVTRLRALAALAVPMVPRLVEQQKARFLERWKEALNAGAAGIATVPPEVAHDRALTEATAFAIRIDVAEELTRLASHLDEIERLLQGGGEMGKRLDFLTQELHREANTLGAKSACLELTRVSIDMKVLIEQMREQVQNIE